MVQSPGNDPHLGPSTRSRRLWDGRLFVFGRYLSAILIGNVGESATGRVTCRSAIGGRRVLDMLAGDQLPRIC